MQHRCQVNGDTAVIFRVLQRENIKRDHSQDYGYQPDGLGHFFVEASFHHIMHGVEYDGD